MKYLVTYSTAIFFVLFMLMRDAFALEANYYYGYDAIYSDNIRRVSSNKEKDTIHRLGAGLVLREDGPVFQSRTTTNIYNNTYQNNTFNDVLSGNLDTQNTLWISPRQFRWSINDFLDYVPIESTVTTSPNNYQQINLFSTGPAVTFRFTAVDTLELETRYENYSEEKTNSDSERIYYAARLGHDFDAISVMTLNYEKREYNFKNAIINTDYVRNDLFFRYASRSVTTEYFFELGKTVYDRVNNTSGDGQRGRIGLNRRITTNKILSFSYRNELSDVAEELGTGSGLGTILINGVPVSNRSDIFRISAADLVFETSFGKNLFNYRMSYSDLNYEIAPDDQTTKGIAVNYSYNITSRDRIIADVGFLNRRFLNINREDDITSVGLTYNHYITSKVLLNFRIFRVDQQSTDINNIIPENILSIGIRYQTEDIPR